MENSAVATEDQSMEEILQSIRRIIAEEGDETNAPAAKAAGSDVLELTDVVTEEGSVVSIAADSSEKDSNADINIDDITFDAVPAETQEPESPQDEDILKNIDSMLAKPEERAAESESVDPLAEIDSLLSNEAATAAANSFRNLKRPHTEVLPASSSLAFRNGATVEDLMIESLRPMLKSWLDSNLPAIVERIVEREVRKLTQ